MSAKAQPVKRDEVTLPSPPILRFSPTAWAKLLYFRDRGPVEVGGFGICLADHLLCVEEFATVRQEVTAASVHFDDHAVGDFFDAQVDLGPAPQQFARLWLHTHPGDSPNPSGVDEQTFCRVFGRCDWAVMFVLAQGGATYARLRFNVGPGGQVQIPVHVDYSRPFGATDRAAWSAEYDANIHPSSVSSTGNYRLLAADWQDDLDCIVPYDWLDGLDEMDPADRRFVAEELSADGPGLFESEVSDGS